MSKSAHTQRSTTRKHVAVDKRIMHSYQAAARNTKRQVTEQTARSTVKKFGDFTEPLRQEYTKSMRWEPHPETCPADLERQSLGWCECDIRTNRQCSACALLGSRQTSVLRNRSDLASMGQENSNSFGHARTSTTETLAPSGLPWESQVENHMTFHHKQDSHSEHRGQAHLDIWDQMQDLLASSEEIFPSADYNQDDIDPIGYQLMPDLDDVFGKHRR